MITSHFLSLKTVFDADLKKHIFEIELTLSKNFCKYSLSLTVLEKITLLIFDITSKLCPQSCSSTHQIPIKINNKSIYRNKINILS